MPHAGLRLARRSRPSSPRQRLPEMLAQPGPGGRRLAGHVHGVSPLATPGCCSAAPGHFDDAVAVSRPPCCAGCCTVGSVHAHSSPRATKPANRVPDLVSGLCSIWAQVISRINAHRQHPAARCGGLATSVLRGAAKFVPCGSVGSVGRKDRSRCSALASEYRPGPPLSNKSIGRASKPSCPAMVVKLT